MFTLGRVALRHFQGSGEGDFESFFEKFLSSVHPGGGRISRRGSRNMQGSSSDTAVVKY